MVMRDLDNKIIESMEWMLRDIIWNQSELHDTFTLNLNDCSEELQTAVTVYSKLRHISISEAWKVLIDGIVS